MRRPVLRCITLALATASVGGAQPRPVDLLITQANVIDVITGRVATRQSIAIRGDTIVAIRRTGTGASIPAIRTVDAGGRFVIPALWDMHVQLRRRPGAHRREPRTAATLHGAWDRRGA
ncbi:MAG: hypothetical protein U5K74_12680 [Gemmatimonadaceae bacterium]|nr:hypothetical protein [Gemmatimonadaceae bacterium]